MKNGEIIYMQKYKKKQYEIENKYRNSLLEKGTTKDFRKAYDKLHELFISERGPLIYIEMKYITQQKY